jgi:hypothetical protein
MNTFLVLFYAEEGMTRKEICGKTFQSKHTREEQEQLIALSGRFTQNLKKL